MNVTCAALYWVASPGAGFNFFCNAINSFCTWVPYVSSSLYRTRSSASPQWPEANTWILVHCSSCGSLHSQSDVDSSPKRGADAAWIRSLTFPLAKLARASLSPRIRKRPTPPRCNLPSAGMMVTLSGAFVRTLNPTESS
eukprot:CAMPEP_0204428860 /NCGR_PEP_ID=MMETSP0470-20130426/58862_1 /ASSEMBLY_ACC=CAM_ASM_000385 /TAXON_ID=2969 /ORGANISM="Oxyrrhis marina" /LENGTH=139 /DNA_ID=CAMNT_0051426813 /DNA_START=12 /DNA_END=427 /DNA_ORIENTATION=-